MEEINALATTKTSFIFESEAMLISSENVFSVVWFIFYWLLPRFLISLIGRGWHLFQLIQWKYLPENQQKMIFH